METPNHYAGNYLHNAMDSSNTLRAKDHQTSRFTSWTTPGRSSIRSGLSAIDCSYLDLDLQFRECQ